MNPDTFIKQVERTAKHDAYSRAIEFIERFGHEYALKILIEKKNSHAAYLDSCPLMYDYGTQTLKPKNTWLEGNNENT